MSRSTRYYFDWRAKYTEGGASIGRCRYRWIVTPPRNATLARGAPPAWGDPGVAGWVQIPDYVFISHGELEMSYDKRAHGIPDAGNGRITVNLATLFAAADTDLNDLADYILNPDFGATYSLIGNSFTTSLTWELYTDDGDDALDAASFRLMFMGGMRRNLEKPLAIRRSAPLLMKYEFDLIHLAKLAMETVTAVDVDTYFRGLASANTYVHMPDSGDGGSRVIYNVAYRDSGINYARCLSRRGPSKDIGRFYRRVDIFSAIYALIDDVYCAYLRVERSVTTRLRFTYRKFIDGELFDTTLDGMPYDTVMRYKRDYTPANNRGDALERGEIYWLTYIWNDNITFGDALSGDAFTGGFLIRHDENSLYQKETRTMWDYLRRIARGLCKTVISFTIDTPFGGGDSWPGIDIFFDRLDDSQEESLRISDIRRRIAEDITPKIGSRIVTGANVAVPGGQGDDKSAAEYKIEGTLTEEMEEATLVHHDWPSVGDSANRYQMNRTTDPNPDIIAPFIIGASTGFNCVNDYYFDTPADISSNIIPILCHEVVDLDYGSAVYTDGEITELPTTPFDATYITSNGGLPGDVFDDFFWLPIRASLKNIQNRAGLANAIAYRLGLRYNNQKQYLLDEPIRLAKAQMNFIGERFVLRDPSGTPIGLNMLLNGQTYLSAYPGKPHCVRAKINLDTGEAEGEFLGIP